MSFFKVMRENHPVSINFHFGRAAGELEQRPAGEEQDFGNHVSTERLNQVFDGKDYEIDNDLPKLLLVHELARKIAEETYTDVDDNMAQLEMNLISVIGQKSVEMNLLACLATMNPEEIENH